MSLATLNEQYARLDEREAALRARVRRFEDDAEPFLRGLVATRVYRDQPELPVVLKQAEIAAQCLEQIEPIVLPEDRVLATVWRRRKVHLGISDPDYWRVQVAFPERGVFREEWPIPETVKADLRFWKGRFDPGKINKVRKANSWLALYGIATPYGHLNGHTLPDHGILVHSGIDALRGRLAASLSRAASPEAANQFRAMDRLLEGLTRHAERLADAAEARAAEQSDPVLAARLRKAADDCRHVARLKPETFPQALQLLRLSHTVDVLTTPGDAASYGRADQILRPYYEADLAAGRIDRDEAFRLVVCFTIKQWVSQGSYNITVGGVDEEGRDATNDLSHMFLEAMEAADTRTDTCARLHRGSPDSFVRLAARVVRLGMGRPSLYNDEVTIEALTRKGVSLEDARDYAPLGCVEIMIPGRSTGRTMCMGLNLVKVLELVLNEGRCLVTGDLVWPDVPAEFSSFDDLMAEYRERIRSVIALGCEIVREDARVESLFGPRPWLTILSRGGLEDGRDLTAGQPKYDIIGVTLDGVADITNSLIAVRRLVFEEERVDLEGLRSALRADWEGGESLRQYVLNQLPRYGQDNEEVHAVVRAEAAFFAQCFENERTLHGDRFLPMIFGVSTSFVTDKDPKTGATPSGRRAGQPLSMSLQPSLAGRQGSVTELLRAISAIDHRDFAGGVSDVQEIDGSLFAGPDGVERLESVIRAFFFEMGGMELSLNFLDEKQLREAQKDPDRHANLMVRLFGLSARFVALSPAMQELVIQRAAAASRRQ